jgi:hypothetical protein
VKEKYCPNILSAKSGRIIGRNLGQKYRENI